MKELKVFPYDQKQGKMLALITSLFIFVLIVAGSLLLHELFSSCCEWGLLSSCGAQASYYGVFCCC